MEQLLDLMAVHMEDTFFVVLINCKAGVHRAIGAGLGTLQICRRLGLRANMYPLSYVADWKREVMLAFQRRTAHDHSLNVIT